MMRGRCVLHHLIKQLTYVSKIMLVLIATRVLVVCAAGAAVVVGADNA